VEVIGLEESKKIINQSNMNEPEIKQKIDRLYESSPLGELLCLYINNWIGSGGSIYEDVLDYFVEMDFKSREYLQVICPFINSMVSLEWVLIIDSVLETKESNDMVNFIKEIYSAFISGADIETVKKCVTLADAPHILNVLLDEKDYIGEAYVKIMESAASLAANIQKQQTAYSACNEKLADLAADIKSKEQKINELKENLAESEKRKEYYEASYKKICMQLDDVNNENGRLKIEFKTARNSEVLYTGTPDLQEKLNILMSKVECINEAILCISDNTRDSVKKGLGDISEQLKEQFSDISKMLVKQTSNNKENDKDVDKAVSPFNEEENNDKDVDKAVSPFNEEENDADAIIEISGNEQDLILEDMYDDTDFNSAEIPKESKKVEMADEYNENALPDNMEITDSKDLLQTGIQTHKTDNDIKENASFFLNVKKNMDIRKKLKLFNKEDTVVKKRQMIVEEAMNNKFDNNIIKGLKQLSMSDTVSLDFIYKMACDKNTSMADIAKLGEYMAVPQ